MLVEALVEEVLNVDELEEAVVEALVKARLNVLV